MSGRSSYCSWIGTIIYFLEKISILLVQLLMASYDVDMPLLVEEDR